MSNNLFGLDDDQLESLKKMHNGCILCGGTGSGKSRTALAYFFKENGGYMDSDEYYPMSDAGPGEPPDLYIITTAHKRDTLEWEEELSYFLMYPDMNLYSNYVKIDSWNNIKKYKEVKNAFFIFDEQKVSGGGVWSKTFIHIAKSNKWILLSATPGDTWLDYAPVFIANGFYRNITDFRQQHVIYKYLPNANYPQVDRYVSTGKLIRLRAELLVPINYKRPTVVHDIDITVNYDASLYQDISKLRWDPWKNEPIQSVSSYCYDLRKAVNTSDGRKLAVLEVLKEHDSAIIFYNYDYELDILKNLPYDLGTTVAELNGHQHDPIPSTTKWVYLVNYNAGAEGWNCITTDTMIFFSLNYSYRIMTQAKGRIDRRNTKFVDLYYYHIKSTASIDKSIARALSKKKTFNERGFSKQFHPQ